MKNMKNNKNHAPIEPTNEQVQDAISNLDPRITLRNLAFWLDLAIAQGRMFNELFKTPNDKKQEVSGNDASSNE